MSHYDVGEGWSCMRRKTLNHSNYIGYLHSSFVCFFFSSVIYTKGDKESKKSSIKDFSISRMR